MGVIDERCGLMRDQKDVALTSGWREAHFLTALLSGHHVMSSFVPPP